MILPLSFGEKSAKAGKRIDMKTIHTVLLLCLLAIPRFANADVFDFSVNSFQEQDIGNTGVGGPYDILTLNSNSGNVSLTEGISTVAFLSTLTWQVGNTGSNSAGLHTGYNAVRNLTLDGVTLTFDQGFADLVGTSTDYVELGNTQTLTFNLGAAGQVDVTLLGTDVGTATSITSGVNAEFLLHDVPAPVPEPEALILLLTILGLVSLVANRKRLDHSGRTKS